LKGFIKPNAGTAKVLTTKHTKIEYGHENKVASSDIDSGNRSALEPRDHLRY